MNENDVIPKIKMLCKERGLSNYALAKQAEIPYSTLNNMLNRPKNVPTIYTLNKICNGLGISLEDFFAETPEKKHLSSEEIQLLEIWNHMKRNEKDLTFAYMQAFEDLRNVSSGKKGRKIHRKK